MLGGGARCSPKSPDRFKLVQPNQILRSKSLRFTKDEPVIIISVEARDNPLQSLLVLHSGVLHQVKVVVCILKVCFVFLERFLMSLGH